MIKRNIENKAQLSIVIMGIISLILLSGCGKTVNESNKTQEGNNNIVQKVKNNKQENLTNDDFDAKVSAAIRRYITENKEEFGKQVIESANAFQRAEERKREAKKQEAMKNVPGVRPNEFVLGNKDSDIVMFEYSDYHCPFCKRFYPTSHRVVTEDNIAVVFRPMPLVHANTSTAIHEIAECIGEKTGTENFWKFTDSVFEKGEEITPENYKDELKALDIPKTDEIVACFEAGDMKEKVQKSIQEGQSLGINGTPTSILKNIKTGEIRVVGGALPYETPKNGQFTGVKDLIQELRK